MHCARLSDLGEDMGIVGHDLARRVLAAAIALAAVLGASSCRTASHSKDLPRVVMVQRVIDGDTFDTDRGDTVRLLGINTPEQNEPFSEDARIELERLVAGRQVRLEYDVDERDNMTPPRILAHVWVGSVHVNRELIAKGFAEVDAIGANRKYRQDLQHAQDVAEEAGLGIWSWSPPPGTFVGNKGTKKFHKGSCKLCREIRLKNRVTFESRDAAKDAQYSPCKYCYP